MKAVFAFALLLSMLLCRVSRADTSDDFVRIACVPEAGLLDVEFRSLHDSVSSDPKGQHERSSLLAQAGFHVPRHLKFSCVLGGITYGILADQDPTSDRMCGGDPEVYLTVTRDGEKFFSNVIFGESCNQLPSVMRFTVGDGPKSWRGRETQVCYATGKDTDPIFCDWTFGKQAEFDKHFPLDEKRVQRIATRQERR
jgi:hypothetical protein